MIANILSNPHVLKTILECQASQKDLSALLSSCKEIARAKRALIYETFVLKIDRVDHYYCALERGALRINLTARPRYFKRHEFDFQNGMERKLLYFECFCFNRPVKSFGNLKTFKCYFFNQPVESFGSLECFSAARFEQPLQSFDSLISFHSDRFNEPISSFGRLKIFICFRYSLKPPEPESFSDIVCCLCVKGKKMYDPQSDYYLPWMIKDWSMPN